MFETGNVIKVDEKFATVEFVRGSSCDKCGSCISAGNNNMQVQVPNSLGAKIGDKVKIQITKKNFFIAAAMLYIVPIIVFVVSIIISAKMYHNDIITMVISLVSTAIIFLLLRAFEPKIQKSRKFLPEIICIL